MLWTVLASFQSINLNWTQPFLEPCCCVRLISTLPLHLCLRGVTWTTNAIDMRSPEWNELIVHKHSKQMIRPSTEGLTKQDKSEIHKQTHSHWLIGEEFDGFKLSNWKNNMDNHCDTNKQAVDGVVTQEEINCLVSKKTDSPKKCTLQWVILVRCCCTYAIAPYQGQTLNVFVLFSCRYVWMQALATVTCLMANIC